VSGDFDDDVVGIDVCVVGPSRRMTTSRSENDV